MLARDHLGLLPGEGGRDVAAMMQGAQAGEIDLVYLLGADEIDMGGLGDAFVVYQGSHGDAGAHRADVILPGAAYTEKNATWVNTEGRVQLGVKACFPPGDAREDWTILRALSDFVEQTLGYDDLAALRARMIEQAPHFAEIGTVGQAAASPAVGEEAMAETPFGLAIDNFYLTNPIARASATMAECSALAQAAAQDKEATGTHG